MNDIERLKMMDLEDQLKFARREVKKLKRQVRNMLGKYLHEKLLKMVNLYGLQDGQLKN